LTPSATPTLVDTPTPTLTATAVGPVELPKTGEQPVPARLPDTSGELFEADIRKQHF
jgi:hypothetical protein